MELFLQPGRWSFKGLRDGSTLRSPADRGKLAAAKRALTTPAPLAYRS